jgi:hypothetical protein
VGRAAAFAHAPVAWTDEILRQHRDSTASQIRVFLAHLARVTMRFPHAQKGETPRVGLEPTTLRLTAGCSAN